MTTAATTPSDPAVETHRGRGLAAATTAVCVWGFSAIAVKQIDGLNGIEIAAYRLWIGAAVTTGLFLLTGGRLTRRLIWLSLPGGLAFLADVILFFSALQNTTVANATVIGALQPILMLAVAGPLFGERTERREILFGAVAIAGSAMVVLGGDGGGERGLEGDLLAVGALLAWTVYFITSKTARSKLTSLEYLTGLTLVAAIGVGPAALVLGQDLGATDRAGWATLVFLAVVNGSLGHFLMNYAHPHVPLVAVSLLTLAIPVTSAAVAWLVLDEPLSALQLLGMVVVVAALSVVSVIGARRRPETTDEEITAIEAVPEP